MVSGYSGTQLPKKLGIKAPMQLVAIEAPAEYEALVGEMPQGVTLGRTAGKNTDLVHVFSTKRVDLSNHLLKRRAKLGDEAVVWVSWPKKAAKVETDIT